MLEDLGNTKLSEIPKDANSITHEDFTRVWREISPEINMTKQPKIHEEMHESGCLEVFSPQETTALSEVMIANPLTPLNSEFFSQIISESLTSDYHVKHPVIQVEIKESRDMERPPQDNPDSSENTNSEAFEPIIAECLLEIRSENFPENNLSSHFKIHKETPLSPSQDTTESSKVINTETYESNFAECSMDFTRSEFLTENHEMYGEENKSTHMKLFLLPEATTSNSENIPTKTHKPTIPKCSFDNASNDNNEQLRAEPKLHLQGNQVSAFANQFHSPSALHEKIDFKEKAGSNKTNIVSVNKDQQVHRQRPFRCKHCDKTYRYLHKLIKHKGFHSKKHSFHCSQCTVKVNHKSRLRDHIIRSHSTINRQKCEICAMEFETNFALAVHTLTHSVQTLDCLMNQQSQNLYFKGGKDVESVPLLPSKKCISPISSTKKDIETSFHKADKSQSDVLFRALDRSTEHRHVGYVESLEISKNQKNENIIQPPFEQNLKLRLDDQLNQVAGSMKEHKAETSFESKGAGLNMEEIQGIKVRSLNLDHSIKNSECVIGVIDPQEQVANVKSQATIEECQSKIPSSIPQSEEKKSLPVEEKTNISLYMSDLTSEQSILHQATSLKSNPKNLLKLLVVLENDVVDVGLKNDLISGNAGTKNSSLGACTSGTAQLRVPNFVYTFLGTEFDNLNKQWSVESKFTPVSKQDFLCNICGKRFSGKGLLNRHLRIHRDSFVCQGCNRSFNDTGSMGCKCLNS